MALTKTEISKLYVSIFNRASEGSGNTYWQTKGTLAEVANAMLATTDAVAYFGTSLNTNQAFIEHIYKNTLNKDATDDPSGIAYWVNLLDQGLSRGEVVASLVDAVAQYESSTDETTKAAYDQFTNRVTLSDYTADNFEAVPDDYKIKLGFDGELVVTNDSTTIYSAQSTVDALNSGISMSLGSKTKISGKNEAASISDKFTIDSIEGSLQGYKLTLILDNSDIKESILEDYNASNDRNIYKEIINVALNSGIPGTNYIQSLDTNGDGTGTIIAQANIVDLETTGAKSQYTSIDTNGTSDTSDDSSLITDENLTVEFTFNSNTTLADIKTLVEGITIKADAIDDATNSDNDVEPSDLYGIKSVIVKLFDASSKQIATASQDLKVADSSRAITDADAMSSIDISKNSAKDIDDSVSVASGSYEGTVLTVTISSGKSGNETLSINSDAIVTQSVGNETLIKDATSGIVYGTVSGGDEGSDLIITMNESGSAVDENTIEKIMENIEFLATDSGKREVTFLLTDDGYSVGDSQVATITAFGQTTTILALGAAGAPANDTYTGTSDNDMFTAAASILASGHTIDGAGGSDLLTWAIDNDTVGSTLTLTDIELIDITTSTGASSIDMTGITGSDGVSIVIDGDQNLSLTDIGSDIKSIDASSVTAGVQDYTFSGAANVVIKGGDDADVFSFGTTFTNDDIVDGRGGVDSIKLTLSQGTYTPNVKNVETMTLTVDDGAEVALNMDVEDSSFTAINFDGASNTSASTTISVSGTDLNDDTDIHINATSGVDYTGDLTVHFGKTLDGVDDVTGSATSSSTTVSAILSEDLTIGVGKMTAVDSLNLTIDDSTTEDPLTFTNTNLESTTAITLNGGGDSSHSVVLGNVTSNSITTTDLTSTATASFVFLTDANRTVTYAGNGNDILNISATAGETHELDVTNVSTINIEATENAADIDVDGVTSGKIVVADSDGETLTLLNVNTNVDATGVTDDILTLTMDTTATGLILELSEDAGHIISGGAGDNTYVFENGIHTDIDIDGHATNVDTLNAKIVDGGSWAANTDINDVDSINITMTDETLDEADTVALDFTTITATTPKSVDIKLVNSDSLDSVTVANIGVAVKSLDTTGVDGGSDISLVASTTPVLDATLILNDEVSDTIDLGSIVKSDDGSDTEHDFGILKIDNFVADGNAVSDVIDFSGFLIFDGTQDTGANDNIALVKNDLSITQESGYVKIAWDFNLEDADDGGNNEHSVGQIHLTGMTLANLNNDSLSFA
jgi:hypothetical protein